MRAISLYNPHAMLVAVGEKKWETRKQSCGIRGEVAIHATLRTPAVFQKGMDVHPIFKAAYARHGLYLNTMPQGAIVAVAEITDCLSTHEWLKQFCKTPRPRERVGFQGSPEEIEYTFGDYGPGRFAWKLENVVRLKTPIFASGKQGWWNVPPLAERLVREQLALSIYETAPKS